MPNTFDLKPGVSLSPCDLDGAAPTPRLKVFVTGAGGRIGSSFARTFGSRYELTLMVHPEAAQAERDAIAGFGRVVALDLADLEGLKREMQGCDVVVHLAATPVATDPWRVLLPLNIVGTYNAFAAAKAAGCRRMVYASSIHAVGGYPPQQQVSTDMPVNPGTLYGVTKCFGESLGRYMANQEGLATICVRIGGHRQPGKIRAEDVKAFEYLVADSDLQQLLGKCVEAEHIQFAIAHGLSKCRYQQLDLSETCALLGYEPKVDLMAEFDLLRDLGVGYRSNLFVNKPEQSGLREDLG